MEWMHRLHSRRALGPDEIRLLVVAPGRTGAPMNTRLKVVKLSRPPEYEALSYVWGADSPWERQGIRIDDTYVSVQPTLYNALQGLRRPDVERLLWADAVCINQEDIQEKQLQIGIMDQIYAKAKSVVVHIGLSTPLSGEGMRALREFIDVHTEHIESPWLYAPSAHTEECLNSILGQAWFTRIWTVQEAVLARHTTFVCGEDEVVWDGDFKSLRKIVFRIKAAAIAPHFGNDENGSQLEWTPLLSVLEEQMRQAARREGIVLRRNQLDVAYDFRHRKSSNPRDKYYAIFSIVENDQGKALVLQPDYSLGIDELHRKFVAAMQQLLEDSEIPDQRKDRPEKLKALPVPKVLKKWL